MYISSACTGHPPANITSWTDSVFMAEFPDFLKYYNLRHGKLLILRDFNIHFDSPSNPITARVLDIPETFNTEQAVSEPTHQQGYTRLGSLQRGTAHALFLCCQAKHFI